MEIKWKVRRLIQDEEGKITKVMAFVSASDDQGKFIGQERVPTPITQPEATVFVDITEDEVVQWVKDALGAEKVTEIETRVSTVVEKPVSDRVKLPWVVKEKKEKKDKREAKKNK